ncbi:MAG: hypothetical protein A4E66_01813 [Syntrophus sp. PtaB.Bin001]|nr:MAG: hypothetical protein A4E66_01813 [Syntrophus sp. PtaB.Bin001]
MAHPIFPGEAENGFGDVFSFVGEDHGPKLLCKRQRSGQQTLRLCIDHLGLFRRGLHIYGIPVPVEPARQA